MVIFICWSGEKSHKYAIALRDWLENVIQVSKPYVSSEDVYKGSRWFSDISKVLSECNYGIVCLTPENLHKPWIHFETGALSKSIDKSSVSPLLFGVKTSDIDGPLSQFQATNFDKDDIWKLLLSINSSLDNNKLSENKLEKSFSKFWDDFENTIKEISDKTSENFDEKEVLRSDSEKYEELISINRTMMRVLSNVEENIEELLNQFIMVPDELEKAKIIETLKQIRMKKDTSSKTKINFDKLLKKK